MQALTLFIIAALLIEAVVNLVKNIEEKNTSWKYWASLALGIVVAVLVSVNWNLDLFKMVGLGEGQIPYVGAVLTGLILARGSNIVADLLGKIAQ
jgi:hypothetical protein